MQIFDVIIFFKLPSIQQKTVKSTSLCPLDATKKVYVAWKRGLPRKFARFLLFRLIKKLPSNLLCVLDHVARSFAVNYITKSRLLKWSRRR